MDIHDGLGWFGMTMMMIVPIAIVGGVVWAIFARRSEA
jgi:hypothetical protein